MDAIGIRSIPGNGCHRLTLSPRHRNKDTAPQFNTAICRKLRQTLARMGGRRIAVHPSIQDHHPCQYLVEEPGIFGVGDLKCGDQVSLGRSSVVHSPRVRRRHRRGQRYFHIARLIELHLIDNCGPETSRLVTEVFILVNESIRGRHQRVWLVPTATPYHPEWI